MFWDLNEAVNVAGIVDKIETALELIAKLPQQFKGDKAVANVGHLLRLPGTLNTKDPENYKPCKVAWSSPGLVYDFDDICSLLGVEKES